MTTHQSSGISYPNNNGYDNCNNYMNGNDKTTMTKQQQTMKTTKMRKIKNDNKPQRKKN